MADRHNLGERGLIWHYTDWGGLDGILKSGELWLSHASYLNDQREIKHGIELFRTLLKESGRTLPDTVTLDENPDVYVSSFTEQCDWLGQWRGYGGAVQAFALGFNPERLKAIATSLDIHFEKCVYVEAGNAGSGPKILDPIFQFIDNAGKSAIPAGYTLGKHLKHPLYQAIALLKDASFKDEVEHRLYTWYSGRLRAHATPGVRLRGSLPTPYLAMSLQGLGAQKETPYPLEAVIVGPGPHTALVKLAVERRIQLMRPIPVPGIRVEESNVPLRTW